MARALSLIALLAAGLASVAGPGCGRDPAPSPVERDADGRPILTDAQRLRLEIRPVDGKDGLFVLPGFDGAVSGGNVAVRIADEGVIIVDDKFPYSHDFIVGQVARVTTAPIRHVLNTHHHDDHAGSNADFRPAAEVVAHRNARRNLLRNGQDGAPSIVFARQSAVFVGDAVAQVHHAGRGHTDGDAVILFPDLRTIHTGDLVVWGERMDGTVLTPFVDYANGGSAVDWVDTLDAVLALEFDTVIPGHGPILTREDVRTFRTRLDTLVGRVRSLITSGVSREAIADEIDLSDLEWPLTPDRVRAIYDELGGS